MFYTETDDGALDNCDSFKFGLWRIGLWRTSGVEEGPIGLGKSTIDGPGCELTTLGSSNFKSKSTVAKLNLYGVKEAGV